MIFRQMSYVAYCTNNEFCKTSRSHRGVNVVAAGVYVCHNNTKQRGYSRRCTQDQALVIANLAVVVRAVLASRSQVACAMLALDDTRLWLTDNLAQIARASMVAQAKDDEYCWVHGSFTEFRPWPFSRHGFKHELAGAEKLRCDATVKGGDESERKVRTLRARNCVLGPICKFTRGWQPRSGLKQRASIREYLTCASTANNCCYIERSSNRTLCSFTLKVLWSQPLVLPG